MTREYECLKILYELFGIPVFAGSGGKCTFRRPQEPENQLPQETDPELAEKLCEAACRHEKPILYLEDGRIYYGLFYSGKTWYCFGPVSRFTLPRSQMKTYLNSHHCTGALQIQRLGVHSMVRILSLLSLFITGEPLSCEEVDFIYVPYAEGALNWSSEENAEFYRIAQSEYGRTHRGGMDFETRMLEMIKAGDAAGVADALYTDPPDLSDFGEVSGQAVRQIEYMVVVSITLSTRAAVAGGMNAEEAYVLGDVYLQKIEQCNGDIENLEKLGIQMQIEFAKKTAQAKKRKSDNLYAEKCKDYISRNLRKELKVAGIAEALGISRTYLARQFMEAEGMSVQQYIVRERCEHAANLLKYSDYPIAVIAEYFCFSSQSHFGSCFKKQYGMTPNEYRRLNAR